MLLVVVARSSRDDSAIRYVFPVLRMTSFCHMMCNTLAGRQCLSTNNPSPPAWAVSIRPQLPETDLIGWRGGWRYYWTGAKSTVFDSPTLRPLLTQRSRNRVCYYQLLVPLTGPFISFWAHINIRSLIVSLMHSVLKASSIRSGAIRPKKTKNRKNQTSLDSNIIRSAPQLPLPETTQSRSNIKRPQYRSDLTSVLYELRWANDGYVRIALIFLLHFKLYL